MPWDVEGIRVEDRVVKISETSNSWGNERQ